MMGQNDGTPCCQQNQTHWFKQTPLGAGARSLLCLQGRGAELTYVWLQALAPLPSDTCRSLSCAQVLGAVQAAIVPHQAAPCVTRSLILAGLWGTLLHLTATTRCGCKGWGCSVAGFICWDSSTSAFPPSTCTSWHLVGLDESANGFKAVLQIQCRATQWVLLTVQQWGKEQGCMRNGLKKSTSILYNCDGIIDGCGAAFLACCVCS